MSNDFVSAGERYREHKKANPDTWRKDILYEMAKVGETMDDVICAVPSLDKPLVMKKIRPLVMWNPGKKKYAKISWLDVPFGELPRQESFTIWTEKRVYFPGTYDGYYWCDSVPRNPCKEETDPVGGGD